MLLTIVCVIQYNIYDEPFAFPTMILQGKLATSKNYTLACNWCQYEELSDFMHFFSGAFSGSVYQAKWGPLANVTWGCRPKPRRLRGKASLRSAG